MPQREKAVGHLFMNGSNAAKIMKQLLMRLPPAIKAYREEILARKMHREPPQKKFSLLPLAAFD